jgi:GT2 family glycosyltransferase
VLILNWNGWADTIECLESVFRSNHPLERLAVVVCDNGSGDQSVEHIGNWAEGRQVAVSNAPDAVRAYVVPGVPKPIRHARYRSADIAGNPPLVWGGLTIVENPANLGFAGGNNVGLSYLGNSADVDYVWILNNDIVVHPDALAEFLRQAVAVPGAVVGGTLYDYHDPGQIQALAGGRFRMWQALGHPLTGTPRDGVARLDYVSGGFMMISRMALASAGTFRDDYFLYCEDVDYSMRLRALGATLIGTAAARGWHKGGRAIGVRSPLHDYYIVRNGLTVVKRHAPRALPLSILYVAFRCVAPKIVRRQWDRLAAVWRGYRDFAIGTMGKAHSPPPR